MKKTDFQRELKGGAALHNAVRDCDWPLERLTRAVGSLPMVRQQLSFDLRHLYDAADTGRYKPVQQRISR